MAEVALHVAPAVDIVAVDLWTDAVPDFGGVRAVRVEPRRWWLIDAATAPDRARDNPRNTTATIAGQIADSLSKIAEQVGDGGATVAIGGGLVRATLTGPGWRALLMLAAVFDAEDPGFGPGDSAATVIHHVPVWIVPLAADCAEVYFPASYARGLVDLWTAAIARGLA